jgi:2-keto-4-pentenoate hydratase
MAMRIASNGGISAMFPVIELHHFVFRAPRKTLAELVANNGINAGAIVPDRLETVTPGAWTEAQKLSVAINGRTIDSGPLWAMPGGANESVAWLRAELDRFGEVLKPGDLVLTGTPLGLPPVQAGDHVSVSIDGRICVDCSCT